MKMQSRFLKTSRILMTMCGVWKIETENISRKTVYNIFAMVLQGNYYMLVLTTAIEATCIMDRTLDFQTKSNYMIYCISFAEIMWKMLLFQSKKITKVIDDIHHIENAVLEGEDTAAKNIYLDYSRYNNRIFLLIASGNFAVFVGFMLTGIDGLKSWKTVNFGNSTLNRSLIFQQWYPFDVQKYFEIVYVWQFVNSSISGLLHISCDCVFLSLIIFPVLRLDILGFQFEHFNDYSKYSNTSPDQILRALLVRHQEIIRSVDDFNDALKWYFFGEFLMRSYIISLVLYRIKTGESSIEVAFPVSLLIMYIVQVFYMCFHANELILKSQDIGSRIFRSNWNEQTASVKRTLYITMIRSTKPLVLHIGNLDIMSNDILIKIFKAGYSYVLLPTK